MLDSCRNLEQEGFDVTYLPVKRNGLVDLKELDAAIRPDTVCGLWYRLDYFIDPSLLGLCFLSASLLS